MGTLMGAVMSTVKNAPACSRRRHGQTRQQERA
jgi:hypothetical protein